MNKIKKLLSILIPFLTFNSCQVKQNDNPSDYQTINDSLMRDVKVKKNVERVCITFNLEEYIAIGEEESVDKIVGWSFDYLRGRREDAYSAYTSIYPSLLDKKDIGYSENISVESIISLSPDVVLASASVNYTHFENKLDLLSKANIPVIFFDYHTDTIETIKKSNQIIGQVLNKEKRATEISTYYENKITPIFNKAKEIKEEDKPKVYMEFSKGKDTYGNTWSKKMWGSLIEQVGGKNIAYNISDANSVTMAKEAIISSNPDTIILTGALQNGLSNNVTLGYNQDENKAKESLATYLSRSEWSNITAVKNRNLHAIYHDLSRHIFDFAGIEFLAKCIQPDIYSDLNPLEDLKDFFHLYMPFELEGCFMISL